jgi:hypothetical protein
MNIICQEAGFGCGIACIAMRLSISYQAALSLTDNKHSAQTYGYTCKTLVEMLNKTGVPSHFKYLKPRLRRLIYKEGTIVFIARSKKYPPGHFLIRAKDCWHDPWINFALDSNLQNAKAGIRKRLPGRPIYAIF